MTLLVGCSDGSDGGSDSGPDPVIAPFQELYDQGINRYIGVYTPMQSEGADGVVDHTFGAGDGPLCLDGSEYAMATRDVGSEDLMIFLQGGGACWSELCAATPSVEGSGVPQVGILDPGKADNPLKGYNVAYLPYCDGGIFSSDIDYDRDEDGSDDQFQRGLHNLSAGLDVAVRTFPNPRRIVLAGSSAGGLGTTVALPLVRLLYPDVRIDIINDAGVGVARPQQPEYLELLFSDWNSREFIPESCPECIPDDGHFSEYHIWQMNQDPNVRRSMLSHSEDTVFALGFLQIGYEAWKEALYPEMQQLEDAHPERSKYWIPDATGHTFVQFSEEFERTAGGVRLVDFISAMLDDSTEWQSTRD
ncbi:pectinacetylesterase family protein [Halioglobus japonicus]|nr:pectinacetylesterase family protein [Halioglobus japonicus]